MPDLDLPIVRGRRGKTRLASPLARFRHWCSLALRGGRQMCGIPDYQSYLLHHQRHHPDLPPLSYEAFFRQRIDARYGGRNGNTRCC
jgi:uncharacterized short protein YbdD (DUF466 family)